MSLRYPLLAAGVLFTCAVSLSRADDWPSFRGPNGDGISKETGLLKEWPKDGPPKVWTAKNLGSGFGTPSVAEGKIFGMGTRGGEDGVWALKESDGSELWFTEIEDRRARNPNTGPSGTPAFSAGKVYAVTTGGKVVCLDAATGKKVWGADFLKDFAGQVPQWGYTETPLVDGEKVILAPGSSTALVAAVNKDTGKVLWQTELKGGGGSGTGYSTPVKATVGGVPMYVVLTGKAGGVVGVHADTGKLLWQYNAVGFGGTAQIAMPIVKHNLVWFSTAYGVGAGLLELTAEGKDKVTAKPVKVHRGTSSEPPRRHDTGRRPRVLRQRAEQRPTRVRRVKTGEVKWGPERSPAGTSRGPRRSSTRTAGSTSATRPRTASTSSIRPRGAEGDLPFKEPDQSGKQSWAPSHRQRQALHPRPDKLHCFNVKADRN